METNVLSNANNFHGPAIQYGCHAKPLSRDFRVHNSLYFKASLRTKSLLWISVFNDIEIRTNYHDKTLRLALKEKLRGPRKEPKQPLLRENSFFKLLSSVLALNADHFLGLRSTIGKHNTKLIIVLCILGILLLKQIKKTETRILRANLPRFHLQPRSEPFLPTHLVPFAFWLGESTHSISKMSNKTMTTNAN